MNPFTDLPRRKPVRRKRSKPRRGPWRSEEYRRWISREGGITMPELEEDQIRRWFVMTDLEQARDTLQVCKNWIERHRAEAYGGRPMSR